MISVSIFDTTRAIKSDVVFVTPPDFRARIKSKRLVQGKAGDWAYLALVPLHYHEMKLKLTFIGYGRNASSTSSI
jgi:hypothetical protein